MKKTTIIPDVYSAGGRPSIGIEPYGERNIVSSFTYSEQFKYWINSKIDSENKSETYFKNKFPTAEKKDKPLATRAIAFLNDGDMILEVEGKKVSTISELQTLLGEYQNKEVEIKVQRRTLPLLTPLANEIAMVKVPVRGADILQLFNLKETKISAFGIRSFQIASYDPKIETKLSNVRINDKKFQSFEKLVEYLSTLKENTINFKVGVSEYTCEFKMKPIGLLGFMADIKFEPEKIDKEISIADALIISSNKVYKSVETSVKGLGLLFKGLISVKDNLSGPVGIVHMAGASLEYGWFTYWNFVANISIALMFMNLLPIPVADGGHLVLYLYEAIAGKPLPQKAIETIFKIGFVFLLLVGVMVTYYDITRFF